MKYKSMKNELLALKNLPIYIAGHIKPDQDSVCSCLALAKWLENNNFEVYVLLKNGDEDIVAWHNSPKNFTDKVVHSEYNFIALDVNEMKRLGDFYEDFKKAKFTINIDHHQGNLFEADKTLSVAGISSTCEIIYQIIKSNGGEKLPRAICELLYCGMLNDTNCFSRRLSKNTLQIAQRLLNRGINYLDIINKTYSNRTLYQFKALAKVVNELRCDDGIYYSVIDKSLPEYSNLSHNQIVKQIAEDLRKIEDIDVYLMLIKDNGKIVAKVMTNTSENADKIALLFGGGGHKKEAGFTISETSVEEILEKVKDFLKI